MVPVPDKLYKFLRQTKESLGLSWGGLVKLLLRGSGSARSRLAPAGVRFRILERRGSWNGGEHLVITTPRSQPPIPCDPCYTVVATYGNHKLMVKVARRGDAICLFNYAYASAEPPSREVFEALLRECVRRAASLYGVEEGFRVELTDRTRDLLPFLARALAGAGS